MSSQIPEDALHKVLEKIQAQVVSSQRQLGMVRAQLSGRERERKMHQLTLKQLGEVESGSNFYKSVGKMFMMEDRDAILTDLNKREKECTDEIDGLTKKQKYFEKQASDAQAHLKDIFSSVDRQNAAAAS